MTSCAQRPAVTVATIVERDGAYLLVEEMTKRGLRLNQPAGHLEPGETLVEAALRETLEEAAWHVEPRALVGIYRWEPPEGGGTFVRFAYAARALLHEPTRSLDTGIERALWLRYDDIVARSARHRSPLVLRCIDDYRAGKRLPLELVQELAAREVRV